MDACDRTARRLHRLTAHLGSIAEDRARAPPSGGGLSGQSCSVAGGWDSFQRRDNRTLFARQSADDQAQFARQAPAANEYVEAKEQKDSLPSSATPARSRADESLEPHRDMSSAPIKPPQLPADDERDPCFATVEPLFGRPAPDSDVQTKVPDVTGFEWFPRMDVVESGMAYVITVELPGVCADGIHVEIVRSSLIVTGSRATDWWKANKNGGGGGEVSRDAVYHLRELAQGPYRACWRLPKNSDVNGISAEFIRNGFLRILVPKIKVTTYL